jgi:hypothetical protein
MAEVEEEMHDLVRYEVAQGAPALRGFREADVRQGGLCNVRAFRPEQLPGLVSGCRYDTVAEKVGAGVFAYPEDARFARSRRAKDSDFEGLPFASQARNLQFQPSW